MQGVVPRFSETPVRAFAGRTLGEHNDEVYRGLGLTAAQIAGLKARKKSSREDHHARRTFGALSLAALQPLRPSRRRDKVSKLVIGFPAGQATDIVARLLAEALKPELGETVIVDNKPGQGGSIALGQVARAAPDGTTFVLAPLPRW